MRVGEAITDYFRCNTRRLVDRMEEESTKDSWFSASAVTEPVIQRDPSMCFDGTWRK